MKTTILLPILLFTAALGTAEAFIAFSLDDTTPTLLEHNRNGPQTPPLVLISTNTIGSGSLPLDNGSLSWENLSTDTTTPNSAEFTGGRFEAFDWGGETTFTSQVIDVSSFVSMDISAIYSGFFNTGSEFSNFFYILDGVRTDFGAGVEDVNAANVNVSQTAISLGGASTLQLGFTFFHNGGSDFFAVEQLTATLNAAEPIPEPSSALLLALGAGLGCLRRRRKA